VQQAGQSRTSATFHGLLYAFGVLVSFWTLAGLLLALRSAGQELGWGFQLQSPAFVLVVAGVFFLLGLSLFGVFEIGTSLMGLGAKAGSRGGALGAFNSGILAVVVATPCTAPFMGSALGYALSQPAALSLLVFTALGLGLALPYVLFTASPVLLRHVPKPGVWMETLKQVMGFLLMATVVWLAWVLGNQRGPQVVAVLLSMLLLLAVAAWIWGRWGNVARSTRSRFLAMIISALLLVASIGWGLKGADLFASSSPGASPSSDGEWVSYDELELARLVSKGTPVLVDFTADWCLSCKVNEQVALRAESVLEQFRKQGVVLMRADWTLRNVEISRALAKFGRSSVPLYVLYPGGRIEEHFTLPEILTPGIVLEALKQLDQQDAT
jgi:thiol:disulfide interchange protein